MPAPTLPVLFYPANINEASIIEFPVQGYRRSQCIYPITES